MRLAERHPQEQRADTTDLLQVAELPEVLRIATEMYARDRAQIERAAQRLELKKAAAEAGLPPEYLERAALFVQSQRGRSIRRRHWRRAWTAVAAALTLGIGARLVGPPSVPPPEAYISYPGGPGGYPAGPPGGYPGYGPPGVPYVAPPGYGPPAAEATPSGAPGPGAYGGPYGGPPPGHPGGPLAGANLRGQAFPHANLSGQDLCQANLRGADLTSANLRGADLNGSDLRGADLTGADLSGVELNDAVYDRFTRWPKGFDPAEHGAKRTARGRAR